MVLLTFAYLLGVKVGKIVPIVYCPNEKSTLTGGSMITHNLQRLFFPQQRLFPADNFLAVPFQRRIVIIRPAIAVDVTNVLCQLPAEKAAV